MSNTEPISASLASSTDSVQDKVSPLNQTKQNGSSEYHLNNNNNNNKEEKSQFESKGKSSAAALLFAKHAAAAAAAAATVNKQVSETTPEPSSINKQNDLIDNTKINGDAFEIKSSSVNENVEIPTEPEPSSSSSRIKDDVDDYPSLNNQFKNDSPVSSSSSSSLKLEKKSKSKKKHKDQVDISSLEAFPTLGKGPSSANSTSSTPKWGPRSSSAVSPTGLAPLKSPLTLNLSSIPPFASNSSSASASSSGVTTPVLNSAFNSTPFFQQLASSASSRNSSFSLPASASPSTTSFAASFRRSAGLTSNGSSHPPSVTSISSSIRPSIVTDMFILDSNSQAHTKKNLSVAAVVQKVRSFTDTAIESSTSHTSGAITFIIKGHEENVKLAHRYIVHEFAVHVLDKITVPSKVRPFIIGPRGAVLNNISTSTQTKINVPKRTSEQIESNNTSDDSDEVEITLEGDIEGINLAKEAINSIVAERTKNLSVKLSNIDSEYFAFLSKYFKEKIANWRTNDNVYVRIPPPSIAAAHSSSEESDAPAFISISGERNGVLNARQEFENFVDEIKKSYGEVATDVPKSNHRFIIGEKGKGLQSIFEETGCTVKVPRQDSADTKVVIFGPRANISLALGKVIEFAKSAFVDSLIISNAHGKSKPHARDLIKYFLHSRLFAEIESKDNVQLNTPRLKELYSKDGIPDVKVEIVGKDGEDIKKARREIVALVNKFLPARVSHVVGVDPLVYCHIIGVKGRNLTNLNEKYGVDVIIPSSEEQEVSGVSDILLVYSGIPDAEFAPDNAEIQQSLEAVKKYIEDTAIKQADLKTIVVNSVPAKFHSNIIGPKRTTLHSILASATGASSRPSSNGEDSEPTVIVTFGLPTNEGLQRALKEASKEVSADSIIIRGSSSDADKVAKEITQMGEEVKNYEVLHSYVSELDFPAKFINHIIGKGGANITRYTDDYGVKIQVDEGHITIKGIKKNVIEAKARILSLIRRLEDEVVLSAIIPQEYHGTIIGQGGKFIVRLQDKYNVWIDFPRSGSFSEKDAADVAAASGKDNEDNNSVAGANSKSNKKSGDNSTSASKQDRNPNEVFIRGPSKGAAAAKKELLELLQYEVDQNNSETITVPSKVLSRIIGKNGETVNAIKERTGSRIEIASETSENAAPTTEVTFLGTLDSIKEAKKEVLAIVSQYENVITEFVDIPKKYYRTLVGPYGETLRSIVVKAGGPTDKALANRVIHVPSADAVDEKIEVTGDKDLVAKVIKEINDFVANLKAQIEEIIDIPQSRYRNIIGPNGSIRKSIEKDFDVSLNVPRINSNKTQPEDSGIKVKGLPENVKKAKERILELSADAVVINVPSRIHEAVSERGSLPMRLRNEYNVIVEYDRSSSAAIRKAKKASATDSKAKGLAAVQQPNGTAAASLGSKQKNENKHPRRIDDSDASSDESENEEDEINSKPNNKLEWKLVDDEEFSDASINKLGEVEWKLRAANSEANIDGAIAAIKKSIAKNSLNRGIGYLTVPDARLFRYVIGPRGSRIQDIRVSTDCVVDVPKQNSGDLTIVLTGTKDNIEYAHKLIVDAIEEGQERQNY